MALSIVAVATFHGYAAAWLAVRMLFRPHNAVGNELVSQETVVHALFETGFFRRKVESFVGSYTDELLNKNYTTFLDAIPRQVRAPVLDALSALQLKIAEHIAGVLKSEETAEAVTRFIDRRTDEILSQRLGEAVG